MKKIVIIFLSIVIAMNVLSESIPVSKANLHGKITDKNGIPVIGASVYITDLKTGGVTDSEGDYRIENLPLGMVQIQISSVGYNMKVDVMNLSVNNIKDYVLEESVTEIKEVSITGKLANASISKLPTPVSIVTLAQLQQQSSTNIIDALSNQPGMSQITTGSGISKPVIRGLGYNRQ